MTGKATVPKVTKADFTILTNREKWNKADPERQDAVISIVTNKLGAEYKFVETKTYECGGQKHRIATFKHVKSGLLMNLIPGGTYVMGDDGEDKASYEKPAHKVTIKAMLIGCYEVRQSCWDKVSGADERDFKGPDLPMKMVSWNDCQAWLKKAGGRLRLPSESEWEYACRSGTTTQYYWGNDFDESYCWYGYDKGNSNKKTHAVTGHDGKENAFGLVDMSGNVWEWCQDVWIDNYKNGPGDSQPRSGNESYRVRRGGC